MKRRQFLEATLGAVGALAIAPACGEDGPAEPPDAGPPELFTVTSADASGHSHTLTIPCVDVDLGAQASYTTGVGDAHTHTVMLTADEMLQLKNGETVMVEFTEGHAHAFAIAVPAGSCA